MLEEPDLYGNWASFRVFPNDNEADEVFFAPGIGVCTWHRPGFMRGSVFTWTLTDGLLSTRSVRGFVSPYPEPGPLARDSGLQFDLRRATVAFVEREVYGQHLRVLEISTDRPPSSAMRDTYRVAYVGPECPDDRADQIREARRDHDRHGGLPQPPVTEV